MSPEITLHSFPDAASRTGTGAFALPKDTGLDDLFADPELSSTAKALIAVLVRNWAWARDHCWPSDQTLAKRLGRSVGQIQRALKELEQKGLIARERTDEVPNGRRIWLLWRRPAGSIGEGQPSAPARTRSRAGAHRPSAPARTEEGADAQCPPAPARSEFEEEEPEGEGRNVTRFSPDSEQDPSSTLMAVIPAPPPEPPYPVPDLTLPPTPPGPPDLAAPHGPEGSPRAVQEGPMTLPMTSEPSPPIRPLLDELKALPGADAQRVRSVAWRLAHFLNDIGSVGFFIWVLAQVAAGTAVVERLLAAFRAGEKAKHSARKPGAVFTTAWQTWSPPPKPSAINRPRYHQSAVPAVRASPSGVGDCPPEEPLGREEEIAELRSWLSQPGHRCASYARHRLAELGVAT